MLPVRDIHFLEFGWGWLDDRHCFVLLDCGGMNVPRRLVHCKIGVAFSGHREAEDISREKEDVNKEDVDEHLYL